MPLISCSMLTKSYGATLAVDALDLDVEAGEVLGLLGPNGAGKTTTLRMLLGLIRPTRGTAEVLGRRPGDHRALAETGSMLEEPAFYPWLSGGANLRVLADTGAPVHAGGIDAALDRAGALAFAGRRVSTYSQGMRQRLGLAAALLRGPRLLLLDEPTNGLDPEGIRDFRDVVRGVAAEGTTLVLSSHLLGEVEQLCDRVAVLARGRLVAQARPDTLTDRRIYRVLVEPAETPAARRALERFPVESPAEGVLTVSAPRGGDVSAALAAAGIAPEALVPERPSLEAWYLSLTRDDRTEAPHATTASPR